jgi:hypothetical protein
MFCRSLFVFNWVRVTLSLVLCMFCRSLFVLLYFFFWASCCKFFFDLQILITSLWYLHTLLINDSQVNSWTNIIDIYYHWFDLPWWISTRNITSNTNPEIQYAMKSSFLGKHINDSVFIEQCLTSTWTLIVAHSNPQFGNSFWLSDIAG